MTRKNQALFLFLFALVFYSPWYDSTLFNIYQGRDIRRAFDLLNGQWIWYGPDLSGGGHTPGPFYYWLIALPLSIFGTWQALVWFNIALMSAAAVVLWYVGQTLAAGAGLILYFLFLNSQFLTRQMNFFWNPSFLFIFQALIIYLLLKTPRKRKNLMWAGLLLGLSLQIHYSQIVFVGAALLSERKNLKLILPMIILPLLPYLLVSGDNIMGGINALLQPLSSSANAAVSFLRYLQQDMLLVAAVLIWPVGLFAYFRKYKVPFIKNNFLWWAWILSLIICFPLLNATNLNRYATPLILLTYIISIPLLDWFTKRYRLWFLGVLAIFTGVTFFNSLSDKSKINDGLIPHDRVRLLETIIEKTNWDYTKFRERTFIVGIHFEAEFQVLYNQILSGREESSLNPVAADGVLIVNRSFQVFLEGNSRRPNWEKIRPYIPDEIYLAGSENKLACQFVQTIEEFDVCIYKFQIADWHFTWNNLGYPYVFEQPPLLPMNEPEGVKKVDSNNWIFYKNICANLDPKCTIYFLVRASPKKYLEITVLGDPLSTTTRAVNPASYLRIKNLQLEVRCPKDKAENYSVATLLGNEHGPGGNGFLTPYQIQRPLKCASPSALSLYAPNLRLEWREK